MMDVEEYLRTSFDDADCEYLDGEIADRNAGAWPHAETMGTLCYLLGELRPRLGIRVAPVIRIRITPTRYRVADLAVWRDDNIGKRIPIVPPFLAIEILSPEDRITRMQPKIAEYLSIGVEWIWLIDPIEKSAICYSQRNPAGALTEMLRTENPTIEIPLAKALDINS
jgi:Uma2 family endonuclease